MAGVKISALPAIVTPASTDLFATVQSSVTYKVTGTQLGSLFIPITGGTMTGPLVLSGLPTISTEAASKAYVDSIAQGITVQGACRLATTGALTVTYSNGSSGVGATLTNAGALAALTLDGIAVVAGDRVLVKNQVSTFQNGIYTVTAIGSGAVNWVLTRALDYNESAEIMPGDLVIITAGSTLTNSGWLQTAIVVTIGTDPITFVQFSASLPVPVTSGGTGLTSTTINQILYSSAANTIAGLATANYGVLVTSATGVPSISAGGQIPGTRTNDSASAGNIGEYITDSVDQASAIPLTTNVSANITSIALTAGDWDVWGNVVFIAANTTVVGSGFGIVTSVSATMGATLLRGSLTTFTGDGAVTPSVPAPMQRFSIAAPTTVYLVALSTFTTSTNGAFGYISARRAR